MDVKREVEDLGDGLYAWVQGDGSWGWSNAGLVTSQGETLLIDTLFTGALTRDMLDGFRRAAPEAAKIDTLVNTHANGDHTFGNHLVEGARIIASAEAAREMAERTPEEAAAAFAAWREQGEMGAFLHEVMGSKFDFSDVRYAPPTETFSGRRDLTVGDLTVELHELGPAHTAGDVIAWLPERRTAFTGDLVFHGGAPILWAGPIGNWIQACELMLSWSPETIVPGHGAVGDATMLHEMLEYLTYVRDEATARHHAGLPWQEAAWDISMDGFPHLSDRERIVCNVAQVYRELSGGRIAPERAEIVGLMGRWHWGWETPHEKTCACGHPH
ncbi:MBL fold metallo-hydrolase [Albimonas sp. CAU 1670]|uniref:MBL fold metallo-hydrolase n=1 Tax=Albimonas sp. CAU 1670 TaxID=3032599 RepID=UPI0023D9C58B|nr:MBL fold metallo-hydrolase [Albimonas sp. CAU 1670]MDF2232247.1 MBL fold metallo-hydrolase [Albimonas sp. CAU 1670]